VVVGRSRETGVGVGRGGWGGEGQKCCGSKERVRSGRESKERVGSGCGSRWMEWRGSGSVVSRCRRRRTTNSRPACAAPD